MTDDNRRTQAQAVFFSLVMVLSIVGGTVAFAGGAAAQANSISVDTSQPVQPDDSVDVTVSYDQGNDVIIAIDGDEDGVIQADEVLETFNPSSASSSDTRTFSPDSIGGDLNDGQLDLIVHQEDDAENDFDTNGNDISFYDQSTTLEVDGTAPSLGTDPHSPTESEVINTATPALEINLTDGSGSGIDPTSIEVSIAQANRERLTLTNATEPGSAMSFDSSDSNVTVDFSNSAVQDLRDGSVTWDITAADQAGNSFSDTNNNFEVDLAGPTIDYNDDDSSDLSEDGSKTSGVDPANDEVSSQTQPFEFDITDGGNLDEDSITASISNASQQDIYTRSESTIISYDSSNNDLEIDPTDENPLPKGDITITIEASDTGGTTTTETFELTVDTEPITVTNYEYIDQEDNIYTDGDSEDSDTETLRLTFNDTVDASTVVAEIDHDSDSSFEYTIDSFDAPGASDSTVAVAPVTDEDISGAIDNGSARLAVTSAEDNVENSLVLNPPESTISIDTENPTAGTTDNLPSTLSGNADLRDAFTNSSDDGETLTYEIQVDGSYTEISDPATFETWAYSDGSYTVRLTVTDDANNAVTASKTYTFDNAVGTISTPKTPSTISGDDVDVEEDNGGNDVNFFDVSSAANDESLTISYAEYNETTGTFGSYTDLDDDYTLDTTTLDDGLIKLKATVAGDQGGTSTTVTTEIDNAPSDTYHSDSAASALSLDDQIELTNANADEDVTVVVESDETLGTLDVEVTNDDYYQDDTTQLTINDFTSTTKSDSDLRYVATVTTAHDGTYSATVTSATDSDDGGSAGVDGATSAGTSGATVNTTAPALYDADITGADSSSMTVRVNFNEPVTGVGSSGLTFNGTSSVTSIDTSTLSQGYAVVTLDAESQTGGDESILANAGAYTEEHGDSTQNNAGDAVDVTFGLSLSDGQNIVSVPAETGAVDLTAIDSELQDAGVTNIWTYESGDWLNYVPGGSAQDITEMQGGDGYIVVTDQSSEANLEVENVQAGGPNVKPNSEDLEAGWNLVGAFQEGDQPVSQAYATVSADYTVQKGYGDTVTTLEPGQGYWTYVTADSAITPVDYDGLSSDRPTVANVGMVLDTDNGDTGFSETDKVRFYADVSDDNLVDSVTLDASNIDGVSELTLTDENGDGQWDATIDGGLDFTTDVVAGETETLTATAFDSDGNLGVGTGETSTVESVSPTLDSVSKVDDTTIDVTIADGSDVDESTISQNDFSLSDGTIGSISTSESGTDATVTINLQSAVDTSSVDVNIASDETIADDAGNQLGDTAPAVTANNMDGVAPTLDSATHAATNSIEVTISDGVDVDESTIAKGDFTLDEDSSSVDSISTSESGGTTTVTLATSGSGGAETDVSIVDGEAIDDTSGNSLTSGTVTATSG